MSPPASRSVDAVTANRSKTLGLIWESNPWTFLVLTGILGGGAAWLAGRALAHGWRPFWQVIAYMGLLAAGLRFFHYALFGETLLSLHYYLVDFTALAVLASLGYRFTMAGNMVRQYRWLHERAGPLSWRERR